MLRIVIATAITTEPQGKSELYDKLIAAVEQDVGSISSTSEVELKDIQIMAMLVCLKKPSNADLKIVEKRNC